MTEKKLKQKSEAWKRKRAILIDYMRDWENDFPTRSEMALVILEYTEISSMYNLFTKEELTDIENEAMELRKQATAKPRAEIYAALESEAKNGNVAAAKEYLDRTEGKVVDRKEITGKDGESVIAPILNMKLNKVE